MSDPVPSPLPAPARGRSRIRWLFGAAAVAALVIVVVVLREARASAPAPDAGPAPATVAVAPVVRRDLFNELSVQAEFRPYQEVQLHAKVAGYLRTISVDFGDQVKAGEPIATLEVPELKDELDHAAAAEQRAEADYRGAHLEYTRLKDVDQSRPNLVAQQDLDAAEAKDEIAAADVDAARSDLARYRTLWSYTRITAPFSGVVTQRYADPGALIQAGTSSQTQPLVRLSENDRLRLDFPVSVSYAGQIALGEPVEIRLEGAAGAISGRIARFTRRISADTRTMETEVEVPNPGLKLIPGMYATAVLKVQDRPNALAVPVEAVADGRPPTVYVIGADHRVESRPVRLGVQTPGYYEVLSGLSEGEQVVIGGRAGVTPGQQVEPKTAALASNP